MVAWFISPGLLILWIPLGFRATCYYYRKAYYRFYFADPPGCAVGEPTIHRGYRMETAFPFILRTCTATSCTWRSCRCSSSGPIAWLSVTNTGGYRLGLGVGILFLNALLLTGYSLSCHSCGAWSAGRWTASPAHVARGPDTRSGSG